MKVLSQFDNFLRELFTKTHGGCPFDAPPFNLQVRELNGAVNSAAVFARFLILCHHRV